MAAIPQSTYRHHALESPERQIRLLSVLPSQTGTQASYELKTYILRGQKTPHFYAISYEWGQRHPLHEILIDGKSFLIRSNLKDCLDRFGSAYEGFYRPVWIDAICIDQSNLAERNAQVKIMGQIYASAMLVLAWFGKQAYANGTLTETVSCLQDWQASQEYCELVQRNGRRHHLNERARHLTQPQLMSLADPYGPMWSCLRVLCEQTYWTRLWIVQELVQAKELLLMWGDEQMPWNVLSTAFRTIQLSHLSIRTSEARFAPWDVIALAVPYQVWLQRDGANQEQSLLDLMETYRKADCSVPHDKAYALTGISTDAHLLQVEYEKSLPDLYVNLMELVQDKSQCARYSHLILSSLQLNSDNFLSGPGITSLRGQKVECEALLVGKVEASKAVGIKVPAINVEAEILELLVMASAVLTDDLINRISHWAQGAQRILREHFHRTHEQIIFFWLSSNQLGAALSPVPVGHTVYRLPDISDSAGDLFIRLENSDESENLSTPIGSPTIPSPAQSSSTFFSDSSIDLASRVWLSKVDISQEQGARAGTYAETPRKTIQIPLMELVAMDELLEVSVEASSDVVPELRRASGQTRFDGVRRRSTKDSASIPEIIDHAMRMQFDDQGAKLHQSSTWPTHTAGHAFIDALSRQLRTKMFTSEASALSSPD